MKKQHVNLVPIISGGQQEQGLRGGTANSVADIALAKTLRLALEEQTLYRTVTRQLNQRMREGLALLPEIEINSPDNGVSAILNFSCKTIPSEVMMNALNSRNICVSAQSTCSSKSKTPSHVPVSYTHLDVYNRQGRYQFLFICDRRQASAYSDFPYGSRESLQRRMSAGRNKPPDCRYHLRCQPGVFRACAKVSA